jgi:type II secretory pathway pseudopilin PulG
VKRGGFTYIEVIIALAVFMITLAVVFPTLMQASRSLRVAQEGYEAHLYAQNMMLIVREAVAQGHNPNVVAFAYSFERNQFPFTIWLVQEGEITSEISNINKPMGTIDPMGFVSFYDRITIIVALWNEQGNLISWAVGFV